MPEAESIAYVRIIIDGKEHRIVVPPRGETLIEIIHESKLGQSYLRRVKNYWLHIKETGVHL